MKFDRCLILFLGLFFWLNTHAQSQQKIDSLKQVLQQVHDDASRLEIYEALGRQYRLNRMANDFEIAESYIDSMEMLAKKLNNMESLAYSQFQRGIIEVDRGNYHKGLQHIKSFVAMRTIANDTTDISVGLYQVGFIQDKLGNYVESLTAYQQVLNISNSHKSDHVKAYVLHTIGGLQRKLGKYKKAILNYNEALKIWESLENNKGIFDCTESLGNTYRELDNFDLAHVYLNEALTISKNENNSILEGSALANLGNLHDDMGYDLKALTYYESALKVRENLPSKEDLAYNLNKIGRSYIKIGAMNKARSFLLKSLDLSKDMKINPLLMDNYEALTLLHEAENNIKEAFRFSKLYTAVKDSLFNEEKLKQLSALEAKYDAAQKDKEIALLTKEAELQEKEILRQATIKNAIFGGLLATLLLAGLVFYVFRQKIKNQKLLSLKNSQITEVNYKQQLSELEMKALRAQMNPHFLFNCLNSINRMILSGDTKEASRYLTKFSRLIRKVLENSEKNMVSLTDELTMLKAYIQLEALRFKGKISYKTDIDRKIDLDNTFIPSMVLQPLIENAIWHGLMHKEAGGTIKLTIMKDNNALKCSVEDDGVGREKNAGLKKESFIKEQSMGLHLTDKRLQIMSELGTKRSINIIDLKDADNKATGTRVDLLIPIAS